jgi:hypothetical protein
MRETTTDRADGDTGISKVKELIQTGYEDGPEEPNRPRAKRVGGHLHIVRVRDGGPHFGVRRLVFPLCKEMRVLRPGGGGGTRYAPPVVSELESMLGSKKMPFLSKPS